MSLPATDEGRCHVWVDDGFIVAAVWIHTRGFYWCQSWHTPDLARRALAAAREWDVDPSSPPSMADELMTHTTWLRAVLPLGWDGVSEGGTRYDDLHPSEDEVVDGIEVWVRRLVAAGLNQPGILQTLTWPSMQVADHDALPDPAMAVGLRRRLTAADELFPDEDNTATTHPEARLHEAEFLAAVRDGAGQAHLRGWLDALLSALEETEKPGGDSWALGDLLRQSVRARRAQVNPFADYLEAPRAVIEMHQRHGRALRELAATRDRVLAELLHDTATEYYRAFEGPVSWADLIKRGATRERPAPPDEEDW